jgi:hypothetical protein
MSLILDAIKFNHDPTNSNTSALNIRKNESEFIQVPEWKAGISVSSSDSRAAYSVKETHNQTLTIQARFRQLGTDTDTPIEVRALDADVNPSDPVGCAGLILWLIRELIRALFGNVLGEVKAKSVSFGVDGLSSYETFQLERTRVDKVGVGIRTTRWRWQYRKKGGSWTDFERTNHRIYVLLEVPKAPWQQVPYSASNTQLPWTDVLDRACHWASFSVDRDSAAARITANVYKLGESVIEYDCPGGGGSQYSYPVFDCTAFLERISGGTGNFQYVNCSDCATFVATFANAIGCDLWQSRMGWGFALNPILAIGSNTWQTACGWGGFSYHEVAWKDACSESDPVFDACLQVDADSDPTSAPHTPLLPTNIVFGTPGSGGYRDKLSPSGDCDPLTSWRVRRSVV